MQELTNVNLLEFLDRAQRNALKEKRYHDALLTRILGYVLFHEQKDHVFETAALVGLRQVLDSVLNGALEQQAQLGRPACSFCFKTEPDVRLAAGAAAFICNSCVATFAEVFREPVSN